MGDMDSFKAPGSDAVKCCEGQILTGPSLQSLDRATGRAWLTADMARQWSGESRSQMVVVCRRQMRKSRETASAHLL